MCTIERKDVISKVVVLIFCQINLSFSRREYGIEELGNSNKYSRLISVKILQFLTAMAFGEDIRNESTSHLVDKLPLSDTESLSTKHSARSWILCIYFMLSFVQIWLIVWRHLYGGLWCSCKTFNKLLRKPYLLLIPPWLKTSSSSPSKPLKHNYPFCSHLRCRCRVVNLL